MQRNNSSFEAASALAKQGFPCFPCMNDKRPACPTGFKAATNQPDNLRHLWMQYPSPLIGVPTGAVSGFDVLDIDPLHAGDQWLSINHEKIPITRTHETRSGGKHFLFQHHSGLRNSANKIAPGVDVRADGGYIIWWPAFGYTINNSELFQSWPCWLLDQLITPAAERFQPQRSTRDVGRAYSQAALTNAALNVARAQPGSRNETLNKEIFSISRFIESGDLEPAVIAQVLAGAALEAGLTKSEIVATIASALRARGI